MINVVNSFYYKNIFLNTHTNIYRNASMKHTHIQTDIHKHESSK